MNQVRRLAIIAFTFSACTDTFTVSSPVSAASDPGIAVELVSQITARLIADAIPREYQRSKDWGRTKLITSGLRSSGNFFKFDVHRRKTAVKHGVWKSYRVTLIEPEQNLIVRVDNLRSVGPGRFAATLNVSARLHGWARAKVYDRGIHIIALEAECDTAVRLWLDAEIALESLTTEILPGIAVRPVITAARLKLDDFHLARISDVKGPLVHELGEELSRLIEDELAGPKFVAKLNRSINKYRNRLDFTPGMLLGTSAQ